MELCTCCSNEFERTGMNKCRNCGEMFCNDCSGDDDTSLCIHCDRHEGPYDGYETVEDYKHATGKDWQ